jgi:3-methyladenine DNA glycosylase AlkD
MKSDHEKIINNLRERLRSSSDDKTRESGQRFFKEEVNLYGVKTATVEKMAREFFKVIEDKDKNNIFDICGALWSSGMLEESFIACNLSYYVNDQYEPSDMAIFEGWINDYVSNWASCDTLCNHTVGTLIEKFPEKIALLKEWTASPNRWVRRAAAVSLIVPAKKGKFLADVFEISEKLIADRDDMVQKGYGWMLKVASQANTKEVFDFVIRNKSVMPRTAYRYAIEKMPPELRAEAMKR